MSKLNRAALKAFFETGDFPTEAQFSDFIDSVINFENDGVAEWNKISINFSALQPNPASSGFAPLFTVPAGFQPVNVIIKATTIWAAIGATNILFNIYHPTNNVTISTAQWDGLLPISNTSGSGGSFSPLFSANLIDIALGGTVRLFCQMFGGGAVINNITSGDLDIWYQLMKMI